MSPNGEAITFPMRLMMAGVSGGIGGIVGAPADMVNVRMQNDIKLPKDSPDRRNYKHAIDGLWRVMREEGLTKVALRRFYCPPFYCLKLLRLAAFLIYLPLFYLLTDIKWCGVGSIKGCTIVYRTTLFLR